jgi:quinol monooxygenase YgiN
LTETNLFNIERGNGMSTLTVVAKVVAKKDSLDAVKKELLKLIAPTRKEEGCIEYRLQQDNDDPTVFLFYENWASAACLEQHTNSAHFKAYLAATEGKTAEKVVHKMTVIE